MGLLYGPNSKYSILLLLWMPTNIQLGFTVWWPWWIAWDTPSTCFKEESLCAALATGSISSVPGRPGPRSACSPGTQVSSTAGRPQARAGSAAQWCLCRLAQLPLSPSALVTKECDISPFWRSSLVGGEVPVHSHCHTRCITCCGRELRLPIIVKQPEKVLVRTSPVQPSLMCFSIDWPVQGYFPCPPDSNPGMISDSYSNYCFKLNDHIDHFITITS